MRVCLAQTHSEEGAVQQNIDTHLGMVERAVQLKADLIVFPELSITNYEPALAKALAVEVNSSVFDPFQHLSDQYSITIGVGVPTQTVAGIYISMLIFQPVQQRAVYAKQLLHEDELSYFVCGGEQVYVYVEGVKVALGICYETLQRAHVLNAINQGADVYIASVAKPKEGVEKAYRHFPEFAAECSTPILMANSVGNCDNFVSVGQSAAWSKAGQLVGRLDERSQGLLLYDTVTEQTEKDYRYGTAHNKGK